MARHAQNRARQSVQFWVLVLFLGLVFLVGGGSRADMQSLIVLRPVAVFVCGFGIWSLNSEHVRQYRFLFVFFAAIFGLIILHLIPLPPSIWGKLPGREVVVEVDRIAGLGTVWRPLSMVPSATWNALYSLFVPFATLLLGVQLSREERFQLLPIFLGFGLLSGFIGLLQVVGASDGPLYFYHITNNGSAVGLFANRNHQAVFLACLFPMLSVFACVGLKTIEQWRFRLWISATAGIVIIPLLLVTGSRAGLLIGIFGLAVVPILYRKPLFQRPAKRKSRRIGPAYVFGGLGVVAFSLLVVLFARAHAVERLIAPDQLNDLRWSIWGPIAQMSWKYFPYGSGVGSFVEVYQIDEPLELLSPSYVNHAHNDLLEVVMTTGAFGFVLVFIAFMAWGRTAYRAWRMPHANGRDASYARMASSVVLMLALGSISDYLLRVPSIICFLVITSLWLGGESIMPSNDDEVGSNKDGSPDKSRLAADLRF